MKTVIFYNIAEYCDFSSKLTIKWQNKQVRTEIWTSENKEIVVNTKNYLTKNGAYKAFKIELGFAILNGWSVLNAFPERETWETKRSK